MSTCNGLDTGSNFARLEREQTSRGCPVTRTLKELHQERKAASETGERRRPFGRLVHFSPKGIVAVSQYRKVGVNFTPAGSPIRATFGRLEPYDGKLSRTVLRGERGGNTPTYPVWANK